MLIVNKYRGQTIVKAVAIISVLVFILIFVALFVLNIGKKTRDSERITIINTLTKALDLYHDATGSWPKGDDDGQGWDEGFHDKNDHRFVSELMEKQILPVTSSDPKFFGAKSLRYTVYDAGYAGCSIDRGKFYILGITDLETDMRPPQKFQGSGFKCPLRDWQNEFDYVVGKFER